MNKPGLLGIYVMVGSIALATGIVIGGVRYNASESMPRGFWLEQRLDKVPERGDAIVACLPATEFVKRYIRPGSCKSGIEPLLKSIGAVAGDDVVLTEAGAMVNGWILPNTAPLVHDALGRELPAWPYGRYHVETGQVWLFSTWSAQSFDSRYLGPIAVDTIIARSIPIWVWR